MGKGDKKSKRGKIVLGTYGVRRRRKTGKIVNPSASAQAKSKVEQITEPKIDAPKKRTKTAASPKLE
jgi:ribosomal small subunit protein bTHX